MIGVVIQWVGFGQTEPSPLVYHKFDGGKACIESVIDNCLRSVQAQKVLVSMPLSERKNISGMGYQKPLIDADRTIMHKTVQFVPYEKSPIEGLYLAALQGGLDHVVRVYANNPLLPSWLLNDMIKSYYARHANRPLINYNILKTDHTYDLYDTGFAVEIYPFWMLAEMYLMDAEGKSTQDVLRSFYETSHYHEYFKNINADAYIPPCDKNLSFVGADQILMFESLIANMNLGYDIGDLLRELNDKQTNA